MNEANLSNPVIESRPALKPRISEEEMALRREAVRQATASIAFEGWQPDAEHQALLERYIAGEIETSDLRADCAQRLCLVETPF